jgi:methionyl-tRNA formyltransferase
VELISQSFNPDLMFCWEFPWKISRGTLEVPAYGSINCHPSLLPRHRGPSPVAWSIRMGDDRYGVTWHRMDTEFDRGPILTQQATGADVEDTPSDIARRLNSIALRLLRSVIDRALARDPGDPQPAHGATEEGPFGELDGRRVLVTRTTLRQPGDALGTRRVECGDGPLWVLETQAASTPSEA